MSVRFHDLIEKTNIFKPARREIHYFLKTHPTFYKVALLVDHLIRAIAMAGFFLILPFSTLTNSVICLSSALFYTLTAEPTCAYKFTLPAVAGAFAFVSLNAFGLSLISLLPLAAFMTYIVLTVDYDVDHN